MGQRDLHRGPDIPRTFYNRWSRYEQGGFEDLTDKPRRPYTTHRTPNETIKAVMERRRERDGAFTESSDTCPSGGMCLHNIDNICRIPLMMIVSHLG